MRRAPRSALLGTIAVVVAQIALPEGLFGTMLSVAFMGGSDTAWAPSYSGWAFRRVREGDSEAEVRALLGAPLARTEAVYDAQRLTYWKYTLSPSKSHFHVRWILFDEHGRVQQKVAEFYVD